MRRKATRLESREHLSGILHDKRSKSESGTPLSNNGCQNTLNDLRTILNVPEAADYLRVSESIVRRYIRERRIPYFKIEGRYLFYRPELEEWVRSLIVAPDGQSSDELAEKAAAEIWNRTKGN